MNDTTSIALLTAGTIGLLCFLTGLAMVYEPAALLALGAALVFGSLAFAHTRGSA